MQQETAEKRQTFWEKGAAVRRDRLDSAPARTSDYPACHGTAKWPIVTFPSCCDSYRYLSWFEREDQRHGKWEKGSFEKRKQAQKQLKLNADIHHKLILTWVVSTTPIRYPCPCTLPGCNCDYWPHLAIAGAQHSYPITRTNFIHPPAHIGSSEL